VSVNMMATASDTAKITIASTNNLSCQRSETSARRPGVAISNGSVTLIPMSLVLCDLKSTAPAYGAALTCVKVAVVLSDIRLGSAQGERISGNGCRIV
jgi:hypothetical protein